MKIKSIVMTACLLSAASISPLSLSAQKIPQLGKAPLDKVIKAMTIEEKVSILIGTGMAGISDNGPVIGSTQNIVAGAAGTTRAIPRLGIPAIVVADGPAGLRIDPTRKNDTNTYYCTAFPVATLLASTWNTPLVESVGKAIGNEVHEYGVDILLAPAMNIQRNPLCGRNFEYYSEDPLVAGKIAAAYIRGIQSNGVGTSLKHFAANSQETNRMANDARISQRALREIYLKGFEIAAKESQPWTVMSSYNYINGTYTSESRDLQTTILRDEWGYKGLVMTDWYGGSKGSAQIHAGNDLLMPGKQHQYDQIIAAVKDGSLKESDVDICVERLLQLVLKSPRFNHYPFSNKPDMKLHAEITRESAVEGMVLLKNNTSTLPLTSSVKNIAAFGNTSYDWIAGGTGSGNVNRAYTVSLVDGLNGAGYHLDGDLSELYKSYLKKESDRQAEEAKSCNNPFLSFLNKKRSDEMNVSPTVLKSMVQNNDMAIITIGRSSGEFTDRHIDNDFKLTADEIALIANVCNVFHQSNKKVVVILNIGGVIETASWKELPDAILLTWQAGQEGGNSVADILSGKVNPSGKLAVTFPLNYMDVASSANFPYDYQMDPDKLLKSMMGKQSSENEIRNVNYTNYEEGVYVGYRYFDTFNKEVSYPFGYGLSYTDFQFGSPTIRHNKDSYIVTLPVKNTGATAGKEVVELYITAPHATIDKPEKELKAFAKTKLLQPGETEAITLRFTQSDLASFDEQQSAWVVEAGDYKIGIGTSSRDIKSSMSLTISKEKITEKVHNVMAPQQPLNLIVPNK
jgi:beta-glucosidase